MGNHPNRSRNKSPSANPTPGEVRKLRLDAGLTLAQAGKLLHTSGNVFSQWETSPDIQNHRRMHPAFWELFKIKVSAIQSGSVLVTAMPEEK